MNSGGKAINNQLSQQPPDSPAQPANEGYLWYWKAAGYLAFPPVALYYGCKMLYSEKYRTGLRQRLSRYTVEELKNLSQGPYIWVHTVSVGELQAARPLLRRLKQEYAHYKILVSTVTETGQTLAYSLPEVDTAIYLPLDVSIFCRKSIQSIDPAAVIVLETEIWPNFICTVASQGIPIFLVNARISDKSYRNYYRFRRIFAPLLNQFTAILAQSARDVERFLSLGTMPERLYQTGNLKFDSVTINEDIEERRKWRNLFGVYNDEVLVIAGSTFAGEELILGKITGELQEHGFPLRLVIAPRHVERTDSILKELSPLGLHVVRRSRLNDAPTDPPDVVILDTIGELRHVYSAADLVFMGKSLTERGGQNPIEPAAWGKAILYGPHMQNFRDVAELLESTGGAVRVQNKDDLLNQVARLCQSPRECNEMGLRAREIVQQSQGALEEIMKVIRTRFMPQKV
ncbi:MAG: 3-deoxy-D-manno-octulosonic acid transferase [bacterium]|jgi:3-deoxy-D-manno-octulosonic-acid transferase